jgi:hypothetical protein
MELDAGARRHSGFATRKQRDSHTQGWTSILEKMGEAVRAKVRTRYAFVRTRISVRTELAM